MTPSCESSTDYPCLCVNSAYISGVRTCWESDCSAANAVLAENYLAYVCGQYNITLPPLSFTPTTVALAGSATTFVTTSTPPSIPNHGTTTATSPASPSTAISPTSPSTASTSSSSSSSSGGSDTTTIIGVVSGVLGTLLTAMSVFLTYRYRPDLFRKKRPAQPSPAEVQVPLMSLPPSSQPYHDPFPRQPQYTPSIPPPYKWGGN